MSDPARLPNGAPGALRGFIACTVDRVELDLADMGWIPKPPGMNDLPEPGVSVNEGWTRTSATIKIGWGFISMELPASIVDGQLRLDTSNLMLEGVGAEINKWVDAFNTTLRDNDKQLDSFDVRDDTVTMTKRAIPAGANHPAGGVAPLTTAVPGAAGATAVPGATHADGEKKSPPGGCLTWVLAGIAAIAVAVGLYAATNGGDDDAVSTGADPVPASSSPSTTTSTTTTTTTTIAEVSQAPPPSEPVESLIACGKYPGEGPPGSGSYITISDPANCMPTLDSYGTTACPTSLAPCSWRQAPWFGQYIGSGTTHQYGATDPITGKTGASTQVHAVLFRVFNQLLDETVARITVDCGGNVLTGEAPVNSAGPTMIEQPLESYGSCRIKQLEAAASDYIDQNDVNFLDPDSVNRAAAAIREANFNVDANEAEPPDPGPPMYTVTDPTFEVLGSWADSTNTINNTLGARAVTNDCIWFFEPANVDLVIKMLDGCSMNQHFWVFAAATNNVPVTFMEHDILLGTTSTFANPMGVTNPSILDTSAFATSGPLFDNTIFPCGYGHLAFTACPANATPVDAGAFVTVSGVMLDSVPLDIDGTKRSHTVDFAASGGPAYTVALGDDGWVVESSAGPTRTRVLFRDDSITFVVPQDELPEGELASSWSTSVDGETAAQPAVPVVGLITTPEIARPEPESPTDAEPDAPIATDAPATTDGGSVAPPEAAESLADFYPQLSASIAAGDGGFALDRLHPFVFEAYPTACPGALASFADPDFVITLISDNGPEPWTWELPDGRSFDVPDAISVTISLTGRGQTGTESIAHVAVVDGTYRWFTFCGDT